MIKLKIKLFGKQQTWYTMQKQKPGFKQTENKRTDSGVYRLNLATNNRSFLCHIIFHGQQLKISFSNCKKASHIQFLIHKLYSEIMHNFTSFCKDTDIGQLAQLATLHWGM